MEGCAMGQVLHGSARTTAAVRRAIQHSQASLRALARRHGINPKTVAKWKKRPSVQDERTGPKEPRSTVLSIEEEAIVVAFRRHTLLPLDDCVYALQATIPHLTRSSQHRCLQRHGISRLPNTDSDKPRRAKVKRYPIGFFHIAIAEVRTEQGKLYLLVAIDRTSKFAFVELHERVTRRVAANFLRALIAAVPYRVHTVLTDNGTHFTEPSGNTWTPDEIKQMLARKQLFRAHAFELACAQNDVAHRLTKPRHPWTNGQVERMNRTIKEATVQRFYYATQVHAQLLVRGVVEALNGRLLDGAVHALDLPIRPRVSRLGQTVGHIVLGTGEFEGVGAEQLLAREHRLDLVRGPGVAAGLGEVGAIVGENRMHPVGHGRDQGAQEVARHTAGDLLMQLDPRIKSEGRLRRTWTCGRWRPAGRACPARFGLPRCRCGRSRSGSALTWARRGWSPSVSCSREMP